MINFIKRKSVRRVFQMTELTFYLFLNHDVINMLKKCLEISLPHLKNTEFTVKKLTVKIHSKAFTFSNFLDKVYDLT